MNFRVAVLAALLVASPLRAVTRSQFDVPAGSLGAAVAAIGQQANVSISVADPILWQQRVPGVKGRMTADEALRRVTAGGDVAIVALDARSWRIVARRPGGVPAGNTAAPPARKIGRAHV